MQTRRTLWVIIIVIGFLKPVFYPNLPDSCFGTDAQQATYVLSNITLSPDKKTCR